MPSSAPARRHLPSSPTRRSSDLKVRSPSSVRLANSCTNGSTSNQAISVRFVSDRKSTRLNSSHLGISYAVFCPRPPTPTLFPYTTLFRSESAESVLREAGQQLYEWVDLQSGNLSSLRIRSEEHTSELQSLRHLVCRLLPPPADTYPLPLHDALPI